MKRTLEASQRPSEWSTGCFGMSCGRENSNRLIFTAKWEWLFIKLPQKYLLLLGTMVSAALNYLYASKAYCEVLICCIKFNVPEGFLCISGWLICVYSSPIQQFLSSLRALQWSLLRYFKPIRHLTLTLIFCNKTQSAVHWRGAPSVSRSTQYAQYSVTLWLS